jgi:hypothetical protein
MVIGEYAYNNGGGGTRAEQVIMVVWSIAVVVGRLQWREVHAILPDDDGELLLGGGCLWLCRCLVCVVVLLFGCVVHRTGVRVWCACAWRACA